MVHHSYNRSTSGRMKEGSFGGHTTSTRLCITQGIFEPTASDASFQNGVAERPNRTLGDMTRSLFI